MYYILEMKSSFQHQKLIDSKQIIIDFVLPVVRGEPEVSSTEITASEQLQPTPSTAVVSGKRQRDEPQVTERYERHMTMTYMYMYYNIQA